METPWSGFSPADQAKIKSELDDAERLSNNFLFSFEEFLLI